MGEDMQRALARLLDDYDARRRGDVEREQKTKDEEALFLSRFAELRRDVIRPVFEAAGALLEARGHRFSITEHESAAGSAGRVNEAGISLRIVPSGTKATLHEDQQSLSVTTRHYNRTVWINSGDAPNSGGIAGAKGAYELPKVTRQLVEDELLAFVARVVAH
jgi:hypothetical protein